MSKKSKKSKKTAKKKAFAPPVKHKHNDEIVKAIENTWSSLVTHLPDAVSQSNLTTHEKRLVGGRKFHVEAIQEYAFTLNALAKQLK